MSPTLEHFLIFRSVFTRQDLLTLGPTRGNASRSINSMSDGFLEGNGFKAALVPGGADFLRLDESTGIAHLDVRAHFRDNQTGDLFYMTSKGILKIDERTQHVLVGSSEAKSTKPGEHTWFSTPMFEVNNEKYK